MWTLSLSVGSWRALAGWRAWQVLFQCLHQQGPPASMLACRGRARRCLPLRVASQVHALILSARLSAAAHLLPEALAWLPPPLQLSWSARRHPCGPQARRQRCCPPAQGGRPQPQPTGTGGLAAGGRTSMARRAVRYMAGCMCTVCPACCQCSARQRTGWDPDRVAARQAAHLLMGVGVVLQLQRGLRRRSRWREHHVQGAALGVPHSCAAAQPQRVGAPVPVDLPGRCWLRLAAWAPRSLLDSRPSQRLGA